MEVTVTASQGPLRSLPKKLEALLLLLDGSKCMPLEGDRKRIRLLKSELEQLISEYLREVPIQILPWSLSLLFIVFADVAVYLWKREGEKSRLQVFTQIKNECVRDKWSI